MSSQNQPNMESQAENTPEQLKSTVSRRKFILGAASASVPVIAAVHSGSAWSCVDLKCSPGQQSLSTGGSAVASAVQTKANTSYLTNKPNWSSLTTIDAVLSKDYFDYLRRHYDNTTSFFSMSVVNNRKTYTQISKNTMSYNTWVDRASSNVHTYNASTRRYSAFSRRSMDSLRTTKSLIMPGTYVHLGQTIIIDTKTSFASIFIGVGETFAGYKSSRYPYILAAFIGAIWERHPEYKFQFPNRPICYPEPSDIVNRFNNATMQEKEGMENLFEFYTTGKVNGVHVR